MFGLFGKKETEKQDTPKCLGLGIGHSFEVDQLYLKIVEPELTIDSASPTQIIQSVGVVEMDGTKIFRFYTDDEAFLQVVVQGGVEMEHVLDVKLFHYYDTLDVGGKAQWDALLDQKIGTAQYDVAGHTFERVWDSTGDYHQPVHMRETTYEKNGESSVTDQFTMLFERALSDDTTESLFLSAEESVSQDNLERCFVISTGITLTPSQITIHG